MKKLWLPVLVLCCHVTWWVSTAACRFVDSPGLIRIKGSDTMAPLGREWAEAYQEHTPDVTLEMTAGGSSNGIAALINDHVEIAHASRPLTAQEVRQLVRRFGEPPTVIKVGLDAVSVVVHPLNPLNGLSLRQLAEIYGRDGNVRSWRDLHVSVPGCDGHDIIPVSRKNNSGTYHFFQHDIFPMRRHFYDKMAFVAHSNAVVARVAETPCAIGYSGMGFVTSQVKTLCIMQGDSSCVPPTPAFTQDNSYPLARPLYMITRGKPKEAVTRYVAWVLGPVGQQILRKAGFIPLPKPKEGAASRRRSPP